MGFSVPNNQTVSWSIYNQAIANAMPCLPHSFVSQQMARIERAFNFGETVEMISAELKLIYELNPLRRTKSPRELALSVTRVRS